MAKLFSHINDKKLNISFDQSEVITIILDDDLEINYKFLDGDYKVLIFNNANKDIVLKEQGEVINSNVEINYIDLNRFNFDQKNNIEVYAHSSLKINSIYLGYGKKAIDFNLVNKEYDSIVNILNKVVCLDKADFKMTIIGKIVKGAKNCKCHQKSNCLTFENPQSCKVEPVLLIDENDVEASHSLSCGTIDEDVLFYMNSRGLDKKASLSLLLLSYLMPSESFYQEFEAGQMLFSLTKEKVDDVCR